MDILLQGFGIGAIGGVVPGAVLTVLLVSVMEGGFRAGLRAFFWCVFAEVVTVAVLLTLIFSFPIPTWVFNAIGLVGGLVLFYFASQVLKLKQIDVPEEGKGHETFSAGKIYLLSATNAPLYIFWVTVCAPLIKELAATKGILLSSTLYMTSFEVGWCLTTFTLMLIFVYARKKLTDPHIMRKVYVGVAILLGVLGARMIYVSLSLLHVI